MLQFTITIDIDETTGDISSTIDEVQANGSTSRDMPNTDA